MPSRRAATVLTTGGRQSPGPRRLAEAQHVVQLADGRVGAVAVGLVDDEDVADLQDAGLGGLDAVAHARREQHDRGVGEAGDLDLGLADADGLDQHHVAAGRVEHPQRLRGRPGQAAEVAARAPSSGCRRRRRSAWSCIRTRSPSSAPPENGEDGSTASTPTRCPRAGRRHERRRRRRLADPGRAGEARRRARCPACGASAAMTSPELRGRALDQRDQPGHGTRPALPRPGRPAWRRPASQLRSDKRTSRPADPRKIRSAEEQTYRRTDDQTVRSNRTQALGTRRMSASP